MFSFHEAQKNVNLLRVTSRRELGTVRFLTTCICKASNLRDRDIAVKKNDFLEESGAAQLEEMLLHLFVLYCVHSTS
jgi:hypothetical protein